jgi:hypothetical protein
MGYKILGYIVWHGAKWYAGRWARQNRRELAIAGAGAGTVLVAGVGAAAAIKRGQKSTP